jgi:peroxin-6
MILTPRSAKELEHFERIRQTFEAVDKSKQDPAAAAPQTIAEAMEAFNLGGSATISEAPVTPSETPATPSETPATPSESPATIGDSHPTGGIQGRIKGLNKWPGSLVRSLGGQSTLSGKGKGKSSSKKGKGTRTGSVQLDGSLSGSVSGSVDGDEDEQADGANGFEDEDDYVVRTDHLRNPKDEVE